MSEITSMDMANVMGSFISTELDAFENLYNELEEKDKEIERLNKTNNEIFKANETLVEEIERLENLNKQLVEECQKLDDEEIRLNNIIEDLKAILKSKGYEVMICNDIDSKESDK